MFSRKIAVKFMDSNNDILKVKKYSIHKNGHQILIKTTGGHGQGDKKDEPEYHGGHVITEPVPFWKIWRKSQRYVISRNGQLIDFSTDPITIPEYNEAAIFEASERKILSKLGEDEKPPQLLYLVVAMQIIYFAILFFGSVG